MGLQDGAPMTAGRARRLRAIARPLTACCARLVPQCRTTGSPLCSSYQQAAPAADRAFAGPAGIRRRDYASLADDRTSAASDRYALRPIHPNRIACHLGDNCASHCAELAMDELKRRALAAELAPDEPRAAVPGDLGRDSRPVTIAAKSVRPFLQYAIAPPGGALARHRLGVVPPMCRVDACALVPGDASTSRSTAPSEYVRRTGPAWPVALGRTRFIVSLGATTANAAACAPTVFRSVNLLTSCCASSIAFRAVGNAESSWRSRP